MIENRPPRRAAWRRQATYGLAAVLILVGIPAVSADEVAPAAGAGGSTLTVTGSETAETTIELATASTVPISIGDGTAGVTIEGAGRAVGILIQQAGVKNPAYVLAMNYNLCSTRACEPLETKEYVAGAPESGDEQNRTAELPAGPYRVVLITDGAPVTASIDLPGLAASMAVAPERPAPVMFTDVTPSLRAPVDAAAFAYSGGITHEPTDNGGLVLFQELYRTVAGAAAVTGTCFVYGEAPPADAYAPFCPTANTEDNRVQFIGLVSALAPSQVVLAGYGHGSAMAGLPLSVGHYLYSATPVFEAPVTQIEIPFSSVAPDQHEAMPTPQDKAKGKAKGKRKASERSPRDAVGSQRRGYGPIAA